MDQNILISTSYRFQPLPEDQLESLRFHIEQKGLELNIKGLFLLSTEGFNSTWAGLESNNLEFKAFLQKTLSGEPLVFLDSWYNKEPFRILRVKIRKEIVTLGRPDLVPWELELKKEESHLNPEEWQDWLKNKKVHLIDTRNDYEVEIGTFKQALNLNIKDFQEFPEKV
ncbi:MAG: hypothetical protein KDD22_01395, partial [Bdellovibrionales bacterium]|nr:hypothetical protein [Bdellovibrionales bacterium]